MTPPIRLRCETCADSGPALPEHPRSPEPTTCRERGPSPLPPILPPVPNFRLPGVFSRPWREILRPSPFVFNTAFLRAEETHVEAPRHLGFNDFLPTLVAFANGIRSMDIDFSNVPVNGGSNLSRFSEYTPRGERPAEANLIVRSNTRARIHGEIRPIHGTDESLITRMSIDFEPNVYNVVALNNLEIDGFSIVDAPTIRYDRRFLRRTSVDEIIGHGDFSYENPLGGSGPLATPFDSEAAPPPHRDWMFRFSPIQSTALSALQESVANGDTALRFGYGALMLWAFFPTLGLTDQSHFDALGIRYNTFPRRLGDVVQIFSPLFDAERNFALREAAPFLNPNTEMLLAPEELAWMNEERARQSPPLPPLRGLRQSIPRDREAVVRFNEHRRALNVERARAGLPALPEVSASRGPVIDWFSTDLARDPTRLAALTDANSPRFEMHARMRATRLPLPFGSIELRDQTEVRAQYFLERVEHPRPGESPVRLAVNLTLEPLETGRIAISERGVSVNADALHVGRAVIELRIPVMLDPAARAPSPAMHFRLEGIRAQNLDFNADEAGLHAVLPEAEIGSLDFRREAGPNWSLRVRELRGDNFMIEHPAVSVNLGHTEIPELNVERSYTEAGEPGELVITGPSIGIDGIHTDGRIPVRDGSFHLTDGHMTLRQGSMVFDGDLDLRASLPNGFSEGPTELDNLTISPSIEDLHLSGRAHFEFFRDGWSLRRSEGAAPLNIGFRIADSWLSHCPGSLPGFLDRLPAASVIQTRVQISGAQVELEDLRSVEYRQVETETGRRGQIRELQSGPITVHHLLGGGSIWVGLPIWGFVRGFFPNLGGASTRRERRPDMSPLTAHLPTAVRDVLGNGDFFRIGGVALTRDEHGDWRTQIDDMILNIHEADGRGQFGGIRLPRIVLESRETAGGARRTSFELDPNYWANIYLNDPDRGGSFRFVRWMLPPGH